MQHMSMQNGQNLANFTILQISVSSVVALRRGGVGAARLSFLRKKQKKWRLKFFSLQPKKYFLFTQERRVSLP